MRKRQDRVSAAAGAGAVALGAVGLLVGYPAVPSPELATGLAIALLTSGFAALGLRLRLPNGTSRSR